MDDSGDQNIRAYSALAVSEVDWRESIACVKEFRRKLKKEYGIFTTKEFHATDFVAGRGNIAEKIVPKRLRSELFRQTLRMIARLRSVRLFNAIAPRRHEALIFERLMNRINTNMRKSGSNAMIPQCFSKDPKRLGIIRHI